MNHTLHIIVGGLLITSCLGQGKRQAQRLERIYVIPMRAILAKEKPRQIAQRRLAGEHIEIADEKPDKTAPPSTVPQ